MNSEAISCREAWQRMTAIAREGQERNYVQVLDMSDFIVATDVFPKKVLDVYTAYNLEQELNEEQKQYMDENRGGAQGDYREGMSRKIANVVDCLTRFPKSKRAIITISNEPMPSHESDNDAKCVRELQLYIDDDGQLCGTLFLRAQAAFLFPKNIHMVGSIMTEISGRLPDKPPLGTLFYLTGVLVADRT